MAHRPQAHFPRFSSSYIRSSGHNHHEHLQNVQENMYDLHDFARYGGYHHPQKGHQHHQHHQPHPGHHQHHLAGANLSHNRFQPFDCNDCRPSQQLHCPAAVPEVSPECTDQCVVIACTDPTHSEQSPCPYEDGCGFVDACDEADCAAFDEILKCCGGGQYPHSSAGFPNPPEWDPMWNDLFCTTCDAPAASATHIPTSSPSHAHGHAHINPFCASCEPPATPATEYSSISSISSPSPSFSGLSIPSSSSSHHTSPTAGYDPVPTAPAATHDMSMVRGKSQAPVSTPQPQTASTTFIPCMWGSCTKSFLSLTELIGHVNLEHLHGKQAGGESRSLPDACHWRDCTQYHDPRLIPSRSNQQSVDEAAILGLLSSHLLQDHLGVSSPSMFDGFQSPTPSAQAHTKPKPKSQFQFVEESGATAPSRVASMTPQTPTLEERASSLPSTTSAISPSSGSGEATSHACRWKGCAQVFSSSDMLTAHLNEAHIGSGKAHYECYWDGCTRNEENGFPTKQKLCRHLQSHTGHRPFACKICKQTFSESATLQQHMRRHNHEKPCVCDYPGCGKAFAATGALTIHKRIHNGHKPFKCQYCERTFSESSNFSKHLRTHTGVRPYVCPEPSCGKAFSRPDQLARHVASTVHKKDNAKEVTASGGDMKQ